MVNGPSAHAPRGNVSRLLPVLALLGSGGWAANHFAALLPVLRTDAHLSGAMVAGLYGLYAVGLLPGLLAGGAASDRWGRKRIALPGAVVALAGTLVLLWWQDPAGLTVGRLVVGLGAGATFSAGTAWAGDLAGPVGSMRAGLVLTGGFAFGPVVSGLLATVTAQPLVWPFVVSAALSAGAVLWVSPLPAPVLPPLQHAVRGGGGSDDQPRSARFALVRALPIAPLVFISATIGVVTVPSHLVVDVPAPLVAGLAAGAVLGSGLVTQVVAARRHRTDNAGVLGALAAAAGLVLAAVVAVHPSVLLVVVTFVALGCGYGLCLRAGLQDIAVLSPAHRRGSLTGVFYLATYTGFAMPLVLEALRPWAGPQGPLLVLGGLAVLVAVLRRFQRAVPAS